jgi:hypothetical protein
MPTPQKHFKDGAFRALYDLPLTTGIDQVHRCGVAFPNGYQISIVYGRSLYSLSAGTERNFESTIAPDQLADRVEVAIIAPDGEFVQFQDGEQVKGYATVTELLQIVNWVATLPLTK